MAEELVQQKVELLAQQTAKSDRIYELLSGSGGFNDQSKKTCKNLEAAITASKRPGYFTYYESPDHVKQLEKAGEVERLSGQVIHLQKQIDQLSDKIGARAQHIANGLHVARSSSKETTSLHNLTGPSSVHSMKQWFATYGTPKPESSGLYTSFTPEKKVYGGTSHYSAFRSQASTMKKGRLTK